MHGENLLFRSSTRSQSLEIFRQCSQKFTRLQYKVKSVEHELLKVSKRKKNLFIQAGPFSSVAGLQRGPVNENITANLF